MEYPSLDRPKAGAFRFNTDSNQLEIYDGNQWTGIESTSPELQTGATRAVIAGGKLTHPARQNVIQFVNVDTTGNAVDFGDVLNASSGFFTAASRTRGIYAGAYTPGTYTNSIEFVTIASTGNSTDFGADLSVARGNGWSASTSTRGVFAGGFDGSDRSTVIDYMSIASTGLAAQDFGDLVQKGLCGGHSQVQSKTRGVFGGGDTPGAKVNLIQFITISTLGNAADFGDLNELRGSVAASSNAITGIYGGGASPTYFKSMDKITIATLGNATDYGDLAEVIASFGSGASPTRIMFAGGYSPAGPTKVDTIQYKEFASSGDTIDFGDLLGAAALVFPLTNGHGGL